jgi:uncharacterized protein (TIGR03437 family)
LSSPRFVLSDGTRLFVADGGNDRVLIFNQIPTSNTVAADIVLGQPDMTSDVQGAQLNLFANPNINTAGTSDTLATPMSLAYDGTNLYVADLYDRRVSVFTPADILLPAQSIRNDASRIIRQEGYVILSQPGSITANDTVTVTIQGVAYTYTVQKSDTLATIITGLIKAINSSNSNAGDPNVLAIAGPSGNTVYLSSKASNLPFDAISLAASTSNTANLVASTNGSYLTGGNAATVAPNTIVDVNYSGSGVGLADGTVSSSSCASSTTLNPVQGSPLPTSLPSNCSGGNPQGSVEVFMDGIPAPLYVVSPNFIRALVPYAFHNRTTASVYVRTVHSDGSTTITNAQPLIIAPADPGLFSDPSSQATPPAAFRPQHQTGNPSVQIRVSVTSVQVGEVATIGVNSTNYSYTVQANDTTPSVAQGLANAINSSSSAIVTATALGSRVVVTAKSAGAAGVGIKIAAASNPASGQSSAGVTLTTSGAATCCISNDSGDITTANPALPGEIITLFGTGLGTLIDVNGHAVSVQEGVPYAGPLNTPATALYATLGGVDTPFYFDGLATGAVGIYSIQVVVPSGATANNTTPVYVAQNQFISNTVTIPVGSAPTSQGILSASPNPITVASGQTSGTTTLSWNATGYSSLQLQSANGAVLASGGSTGSYTANNVTDGTIFKLVDANTGNTLSTLTITVVQNPGLPTYHFPDNCPAPDGGSFVVNAANTFSAQPSTILVPQPLTQGQTTLIWSTPGAATNNTDIYRANDPTHPHVTGASGIGQVTTSPTVTDNTVFWLQDVTTTPAPGVTLGCVRVKVIQTAPPTGFVSANPGVVIASGSTGRTTISWHCNDCVAPQLRISDPVAGIAFAAGSSGVVQTTVSDGETIYLVDAANTSKPVVVAHTVVHVQSSPGQTIPPPNRGPLPPRPIRPTGPMSY